MQREESTWIVLLQSSSLVTSVTRGLDDQCGGSKGIMRGEECERGSKGHLRVFMA